MDVSGPSDLFQVGTGTITDVSNAPLPLIAFETVPGAGALSGQTINFDLTSIPTSSATVGNCTSNAAFNSCTPAFSPITLAEDSTGLQVTITFTTLIDGYTGSSLSGSTAYRALFTTQQSGTLVGLVNCAGLPANITNILSCEAAGGTITATWSATESPLGQGIPGGGGAPEPASMFLIGAGLPGLGSAKKTAAPKGGRYSNF